MSGRFGQERRLWFMPPLGQLFSHLKVTEPLFASLISGLFYVKSTIPDKAAASGKTPGKFELPGLGLKAVSERLKYDHK